MKRPKTVPHGFNKAVQAMLGGQNQASSSYISMVRRGTRTNDAVLLEIIRTDHNWKEIQHERLKKML